MHINRGLLGWGVFFIALGSVPLAVRSGSLDPAIAARAWELWPLVLIGIGLGLVLQRTRAAAAGGLVVAVTFGLMFGSLLAGGFPGGGGIGACGFGVGAPGGSSFAGQDGSFGPQARVDLDFDCGELVVRPSDGSGWSIAGTSNGGVQPEVSAGADRLRISTPDRRGIGLGISGSRWQVSLPRSTSLELGLAINAGSAILDLGAMRTPALSVSVNAGDAHVNAAGLVESASVRGSVNAGSLAISLPAPAGTLTGSLSVNAGSVEVCVPDGVGLRIRLDRQALGSDNFGDRGLVRAGATWTRPGFETASQRIDLTASANLGSITLNPENGCD